MLQKTTLPAISLLGLLALLSLSCASSQKTTPVAKSDGSACPDTEAGETPEDCPWAGVARSLNRIPQEGGSVSLTLAADFPLLEDKFHADQERKDWLKLWGRSINFDELAHGVILNPAIAQALSTKLGGPAPEGPDARIVHAGIEHTYGYLFSLLKTPYGFKRARWVKPTIDRGFGFSDPTISPLPTVGTLLGNATYFLGQIAFRGEESALAALASHSNRVPDGLRVYEYGKLDVRRIEERVRIPAHGKSRGVVLRTDLVAFPHPVPKDSNTHLLIYSVTDPTFGGSVLITAFPVTQAFVEQALNPANLGHHKPIVSRYNAYVVGLSDGESKGRTLRGSREVVTK
jgi:hypothetical protein